MESEVATASQAESGLMLAGRVKRCLGPHKLPGTFPPVYYL